MRVPAVMMLGFVIAACSFNPSGQIPGEEPDASPGEDGREPDDGPRPPDDGNDPTWWNPAFRARVPITIGAAPTTELLADVPVLVVLDGDRIDYDRTADDGRDLRFIDQGGNELAYEIEHWDPDGRSFVWVRVPEIAAGASTTFWLYHDNDEAQATGGQVWSDDYLAVWHLAEDTMAGESGATHRDATDRGNDGTQNGNGFIGPESQAIGGAQNFSGSDVIEIPEAGLQESGTALTLLARVYVDEEPNDFSYALGSGGGEDVQWQIAWGKDANAWTSRIDTMGGRAISVSTDSAALQTWYLVAMVYDGAQAQLYVDGEPLGNAVELTGNLEPLAGPLYIGKNPDEAGSTDLDGIVDEVRIAKVARSQSWLRVQHASMNDDLLDFGADECLGGC